MKRRQDYEGEDSGTKLRNKYQITHTTAIVKSAAFKKRTGRRGPRTSTPNIDLNQVALKEDELLEAFHPKFDEGWKARNYREFKEAIEKVFEKKRESITGLATYSSSQTPQSAKRTLEYDLEESPPYSPPHDSEIQKNTDDSSSSQNPLTHHDWQESDNEKEDNVEQSKNDASENPIEMRMTIEKWRHATTKRKKVVRFLQKIRMKVTKRKVKMKKVTTTQNVQELKHDEKPLETYSKKRKQDAN